MVYYHLDIYTICIRLYIYIISTTIYSIIENNTYLYNMFFIEIQHINYIVKCIHLLMFLLLDLCEEARTIFFSITECFFSRPFINK